MKLNREALKQFMQKNLFAEFRTAPSTAVVGLLVPTLRLSGGSMDQRRCTRVRNAKLPSGAPPTAYLDAQAGPSHQRPCLQATHTTYDRLNCNNSNKHFYGLMSYVLASGFHEVSLASGSNSAFESPNVLHAASLWAFFCITG